MICRDCPNPITAHSRTGRCRDCACAARNRSPEMRAVAAALMRKKRADPEFIAKQKPNAAALAAHYQIPVNRARILAAGAKGRESRRVPEPYRALMAALHRKRLPPGEARRLLDEQVQADARRTVRDNLQDMERREARRQRELY